MNTEFKPIRIGSPDFHRMSKIREKYELLLSDFHFLISDLTDLQNGPPPTFEQIRDFIRCTDPVSWVTRVHIEVNDIKFHGLSLEKLIASGLVEIPDSVMDALTKSRKLLKESMEGIQKTGFVFPLAQLWGYNSDFPDRPGFWITKEFQDTLENFCSVFTRNQQQNLALPVVKVLVKTLNKLHKIGFFNMQHGVPELSKLQNFLDFDRLSDEPVEICKSRFAYACKQPGDSFNVPRFSASDLFEVKAEIIQEEVDPTEEIHSEAEEAPAKVVQLEPQEI